MAKRERYKEPAALAASEIASDIRKVGRADRT